MKEEKQQRDISEIMNRDVWGLIDVCDYLGVKPGWVYGAVHRREIPHKKIGLYLKFKKTDVLAWFDKHERGAAA